MLGWDKYITTLRLLRYLESESWTKPCYRWVSFTRAEKPAHWKMRNDDMEILLTDDELQYLALQRSAECTQQHIEVCHEYHDSSEWRIIR